MFKKLSAFYKKNRVYSILMIISIICIVSILVGVIMYFIGQTNKDKYGTRLDGIESVIIKDKKLNEIEDKISENELVKEVDIHIKGKLIYINITLNTGKHTDSESIAQTSLDLFSEEEKAYYDIQYIVSNEDKEIEEKFPVMGYIKAGNSVIKWTSYEIKVEETEGDVDEN